MSAIRVPGKYTTMPQGPTGPSFFDVAIRCFCGGVGCGCAGFVTNPCDVVKIRNQQYGGAQFGGFLGTFKNIYASEGIGAFLKGAQASVLREATYSSVRMGFYEPIKMIVAQVGIPDGPIMKWVSSFLSGGIGAAMFNPIDLIKVRLQSSLTPGGTLLSTFRDVYGKNGLRGLWAGTTPTVVRAALLTSAQLGTYDVIQNDILVKIFGLDKSAHSTHLASSLTASVITVTASNPPDVVKTRVMNCRERRGPGAHMADILRTDGPMGFMKGWTASYFRLGPHTVISLMLIEKVRHMVGLSAY
eukprot:CAMPEP_0206462676 /NCGR_PEP_ID=MMETSP0324_2-20121206/26123_1 /ASSEMBLY_ACC=CAM_ASM_000836 /TAXON_ID=2866 /ORGANISM="Crypthecodinium cohnii, Strain Seligo" /LENGTH=300 /DNA_ID=CAMNT_0053934883 /DNA_START=24 /DNA_END=926 /DNA_ORIENTATION=-